MAFSISTSIGPGLVDEPGELVLVVSWYRRSYETGRPGQPCWDAWQTVLLLPVVRDHGSSVREVGHHAHVQDGVGGRAVEAALPRTITGKRCVSTLWKALNGFRSETTRLVQRQAARARDLGQRHSHALLHIKQRADGAPATTSSRSRYG